MGPPLSSWPYSHPQELKSSDNKRVLVNIVDNLRNLGLNFTFVFIFIQVFINLSAVSAGPVILSLDYLRGPAKLARNIRHLPCVSRTTGQEGLCMFAIDCLKTNGTHLGTCIDRFYFGSCCQIPDKLSIPHMVDNSIEDNSIDDANFVHPLINDKVHSAINKIPYKIFPHKDKTNENLKPIEKYDVSTNNPTTVQDITYSDKMESKSDELLTVNHLTNDDVKTTDAMVTTSAKETTTQSIKASPLTEVTDLPFKISTFPSVSVVSNVVTETTEQKPTKPEITEETSVKPTRKPVKPTYKPRPYRPNFTRPSISPKPRPTKPIALFNTTRKPPYRPPPKRNTTKKPLPSPPRLNTIKIPQSTSPSLYLTRPSASEITYINSTVPQDEERVSTPPSSTRTTNTPSTTLSTAPSTTTTTTTTTPLPTTTSTTTTTTTTTEAILVTTERTTVTTENITTETLPPAIEPHTEKITEKVTERVTTGSEPETTEKEIITESDTTLVTEVVTLKEEVTEKETLKPATEGDIPVSIKPATAADGPVTTEPTTDYPPLVTWTNNEASSKAPATLIPADDWLPNTLPEDWFLTSTPSPIPETTKAQTTTGATETTENSKQTAVLIEATSTSTTTSTSTSASLTSEMEFVVNITLSPTAPTPTPSMGLTPNVNQTRTTTMADLTTIANVTTTEATTVITTTTESYNMSNYKEVCGRRMWPQARIVGGAKSGFGQWPWQISLRQYRTSTYLHKCGAALLNENWAITAAHCVNSVPPSDLLLHLGEYDLANDDEPYGFAERRVQIVASHPHFDTDTYEYDLALLRFYEPVTFQPNILPVCVPDDDDDYVGRTAYVTGWGRLYEKGPLPSVLQEVEVPVINNTECESMYLAAGYSQYIPDIFICAGWTKGGFDSCEGDSGGPMVVQRSKDDRFVLSGLISWGIGCAEPNKPGVYTRISEFRDWINQILLF